MSKVRAEKRAMFCVAVCVAGSAWVQGCSLNGNGKVSEIFGHEMAVIEVIPSRQQGRASLLLFKEYMKGPAIPEHQPVNAYVCKGIVEDLEAQNMPRLSEAESVTIFPTHTFMDMGDVRRFVLMMKSSSPSKPSPNMEPYRMKWVVETKGPRDHRTLANSLELEGKRAPLQIVTHADAEWCCGRLPIASFWSCSPHTGEYWRYTVSLQRE